MIQNNHNFSSEKSAGLLLRGALSSYLPAILSSFLYCSLFIFSFNLFALTPADTIIQNQSTATYHWAGRDYGIASNSVNNRVAPSYGIQILPDGTQANPAMTAYGEPGQTIYFPYRLTNTGNVTDSYDLSWHFLGGNFFPSGRKIYLDTNGNGRLDAGEPEVTFIEQLPAGESVNLIMAIVVPTTAAYGQEVYHDLRGKSQGDPSLIDENNVNCIKLVNDALLKINKTPAQAYVSPGGTVDFTLTVINHGNYAASAETVRIDGVDRYGVLVSDELPGTANQQISLVPGSVSAAPANNRKIFKVAGSNEWRELSLAEQETYAADILEIGVLFEAPQGLLSSGQQAVVKFALLFAEDHPAGYVYNTSRVRYRGRHNEPKEDNATNNVQIKVLTRTNDILIGPYLDPDAVGNTFGVTDNNGDATYDPGIPVDSGNPWGTQVTGNTVYFLNTVRNDSNTVDTINLTIDSLTNLPPDWLQYAGIMAISGVSQRMKADNSGVLLHPETGEELFKPSNVSTLFDTNGDGIPDTGPLEPGQTRTVAIRVVIPHEIAGFNGRATHTRGGAGSHIDYADNNGQGYRVTVRAQSVIDPSKYNLTSNIIKRIMLLRDLWDPFEKQQSTPAEVKVGSTIKYTNIFGNNGPGPVYNVVIIDELNENLANVKNISQGIVNNLNGGSLKVNVTGEYDTANRTVRWYIPEVPSGFKGKISFEVEIAPGTPDGTEIPNVFGITSEQTNNVHLSNEVVEAVGGENILTITKKVSSDKAEIGDPVRYELEVTNKGSALIRNVTIDDLLPIGFRYNKGSARVDNVKHEPEISKDALMLFWHLGDLPAGKKVIISYVCILTTDVKIGTNTNEAWAKGRLPLGSTIRSSDSADVDVEEGIFHNDSVIIGRVFIDQNDDRVQNHAEPGIEGVRLILEDGTYVLTDREGKYHLSGIKPGMHVLRMDETTLPEDVVPAIIDSQNMMNPLSRTIELRYGTLHKANFRVLPKKMLEEKEEAKKAKDDVEGETEEALEVKEEFEEEAAVAPNVLLPVKIERQGAASFIKIDCEEALEAEFEFDENSGIVHIMLPGVQASQQADIKSLDDPNVSSLRCYLDEEQNRAKLQIRTRKRSSGYADAKIKLTETGVEVLVGSEKEPDNDPDPASSLRRKKRIAAMPELIPIILSPEDGDAFITGGQISVTAACFLAGQAELFINGEKVGDDRIGQRAVDVDARRMTYVYYGLSIKPGKNVIRFEVMNPGAKEPEVAEITVVRAAIPKSIKLEVSPKNLMADSITEPQLKISLFDENDVPTGHGSVVTVTVDKGDILSPDLRITEPGHQAQVKEGSAIIRLSAASSPESRQIRVIAGDLNQTLTINFSPHQRSWIVSGIASANVTESKTKERNTGKKDRDYDFDERLAFFAKGKLPHDMVLTTSYDSKKPRNDDKVFQKDDPLKYYPVYGDDSEQQYEAESRDKLYLKLEREQSYVMYGDFDTGLDKAELAAYRRTMTGAQMHIEEKYVDIDAFFSRNDQVKIKGLEIQGRGVSGYYRLPDRDIIYNSERVVIETRDRYHLDQVIKSESMKRYTDYSIDYSTGRILFKKPVLSRDENNNPIYIVVDYEVDGRKNKNYNTYGGRVELHNELRTMHIGYTQIQDEATPYDHKIQGVDGKIQLMEGLNLAAEYAQSTSTEDISGSAMRLELEGEYERAKYKLYHRRIGSRFDNDSMSGSTAGRTTTGFEGEFQISEHWFTEEDFFKETDKNSDRERYVGIHDFVYKKNNNELLFGLGYTQEEDISSDLSLAGKKQRSPFARVGAAFDLSEKLRLELLHQQAFGDMDTDQATRSSAELRYHLNNYADLLFGMERRRVNKDDTDFNLTGGIELQLTESVSAFNRYKLEDSANGQRVRAGTGLDAEHQLNEDWRVGGTVEISRVVKQKGELSNDDFWALSLSTEYQPQGGRGTAITRYEMRYEDTEISYLGEIGGTLKLNQDNTVFGRNIANFIKGKKDKKDGMSLDFLVGWAYRPVHFDKFNWISDLELKYEKDNDVADYGRFNRLILSTEANWQPMHRLVLEGKYACKLTDTSYLSSPLFSDVKAVAARVDLTDRFFVSAGSRILSQYESETHTLSYGVTLGVNVVKDFRVALGYNFEGFKDKDFSRAEHWDKGFFVAFHWKFDESIFGILNRLEGKK